MVLEYDSIKCTGYSVEGSGDDEIKYVLVKMTRSDIWKIRDVMRFAAENADEYAFISDCVKMDEILGGVLMEHSRLIDEAEL